MRDRKRLYTILLLIPILWLVGLALVSRPDRAALAGPLDFTYPAADVTAPTAYTLSWDVFASGGSLNTSSASYTMQSTIGQAVAGQSASASYDLCSGYWCGFKDWIWDIFLPFTVRD
jgi:hypothetical protein